MNIDPQIVAQAKAFVNAWKTTGHIRTPAMKFSQWPQFMKAVNNHMQAS